ncbi:hypothetical protein DBR42_23290 [Pelomonas sp. HMWF004]|nr:hypothetical protein DBR42_23290 [Pelomonas sp. HMWF004]
MPPLTAEQLAYVVTHSELLALLSLQRLEAMLDASPAPPPPTAEELAGAEAAVQADLQRLQQQWLDQSTTGTPADANESLVIIPASAALTSSVAVDISHEIDAALARAYADIPARVQSLQGVDPSSLMPALAALTEALPPLTQALNATDITAWLDLHDAGDPALSELMEHASALGGSAG